MGTVSSLVDCALLGHLSEDLVHSLTILVEAELDILIKVHTKAINRTNFGMRT